MFLSQPISQQTAERFLEKVADMIGKKALYKSRLPSPSRVSLDQVQLHVSTCTTTLRPLALWKTLQEDLPPP